MTPVRSYWGRQEHCRLIDQMARSDKEFEEDMHTLGSEDPARAGTHAVSGVLRSVRTLRTRKM